MSTAANNAMQELLGILDLEMLEHNLYRGRSPQTAWQRVFGGQVIGQALIAAQRTVHVERHVHSLHCYFMRPGDIKVPIIYEVDRIRDGGSFTTRRVVAIQNGQAIFALSASFQKDEDGLEHQVAMPLDMPDPETLPSQADLLADDKLQLPDGVRRYMSRERPVEFRPVDFRHYASNEKLPPHQHSWMRVNGDVPDSRALRSAMLAYFSDMTLLDTATYPHGFSGFNPNVQMASLDHAMWFHRPVPVFDDWMLYTQDSPATHGARGFSRGQIFTRDGTLIASVAQEGLLRLKRE